MRTKEKACLCRVRTEPPALIFFAGERVGVKNRLFFGLAIIFARKSLLCHTRFTQSLDSESPMSGRHIHPGNRRASFGRRASALLLGAWVLAATPVCAEPFRFPWDDPPPPVRQQARPAPSQMQQFPQEQRPLGPARLSSRQVRAILAREGAQMIGKPRAIRDELIVLGRDSNGEGKKYILDAISGDVLAVQEARLPEPRRDDLGSPLPPPVHAPSPGDGRIESAPLGAPPQSPPVASAPPPAAAPAPDRSDTALSPIKPLRPPGAPRVEPLPK
jgi:hypothetical protein